MWICALGLTHFKNFALSPILKLDTFDKLARHKICCLQVEISPFNPRTINYNICIHYSYEES